MHINSKQENTITSEFSFTSKKYSMWNSAFICINALLFLLVSAASGQCFTEKDDNAQTTAPTTIEKLVNGSTEFALKLFANVHKTHKGPNDNVIISPISLWSALTATWHGARGQTKQQLENVLMFGDDNQKRVSKLYHELTDGLQHNDTQAANYTFNLINKVYFDENVQLRDCILEHLDSETEKLKLAAMPDASRATINKWVEDQTNHKIVKLLPDNYIDAETTMVLINAAYFRGYWAQLFHPDDTVAQDFFIEPNNTIKVDMMRHFGRSYRFDEINQLQCSAIELPYSGNEVSMTILLPNENTKVEDLVSKLDVSTLKILLSSLSNSIVDLSVPKFKIEQSMELEENLKELGIEDLFDQSAADLSGFSSDKKSYVSFIRQKTIIDVTESGTEAAAGTAVQMSFLSLPTEFHVNRPFVFLIQNKNTGSILLLGIIRDPRNGATK